MAGGGRGGAVPFLLTPRGPGGVAVVAFEGPDRAAAARGLLRTVAGEPFELAARGSPGPAPRLALLCPGGGEPVDQVLVVEREAAVEVHLHGSEAVLVALERAVGPLREPATDPAGALVRGALSEAQLALGLEQRGHDFERFAARLEALPEAERARRVEAALQRSRAAMALAEPCRLVLCGAQNAGKSTLMNRLLFRERALTGARAGLTRDPVREETTLDGYPYLVVDTAGEGAVDSELDRRAVQLGRHQRVGALVVIVVDGSRGPGELESQLAGTAHLWVQNKADLSLAPWPERLRPRVTVSCLDAAAAPEVRRRIGDRLTALRGLPVAGPAGGPAALCAEQYARLRRLV